MSFLGVSALCGLLAAGLIFPLAATGGAAASAGSDILEDVPAELREEPLSTPSRVYANDGETEIARFYAENRRPVNYDDIAQSMKDAIISIEDERFYEHGGVDARGVGRAAVHNLTRPTQQGASTLTQQYVNNVLNNAAVIRGEGRFLAAGIEEKTYADKLREMKLAVALEQEMTKEEILEGYLNIVLFGGQNYGVEAAAQYYWGVSASELNIQQSAVLAGMVQSPNAYNPVSNPGAAQARRDVVLGTMERNGYITQEEYEEAVNSELGVDNPDREFSGCVAAEFAEYFCDYIYRIFTNDEAFQAAGMDEAFGETAEERLTLLERGGLNIVTTLDPDLQRAAEEETLETVPAGDPSEVIAALTSLDPKTGNILSMAQSTEYDPDTEGQGNTTVNYNVDYAYGQSGGFQGGSILKPFIAAAWVEEGGSLDDQVDASQTEYDDGDMWEASCRPGGEIRLNVSEDEDEDVWEILNVIDEMNRNMTIDFGLYYSINTATVATAYDMDLCAITDLTDRLEIKNAAYESLVDGISPDTPSFVLGSLEFSPMTMAAAYATFANDGERCEPRALLEVTDAAGNEYNVPEVNCEQVIDPEVVAQVNDTMINIAEQQFGNGNPPFPMAGKTGTNNFASQTWFQGFTEGIATSAYVGRTREIENSLFNSTVAGQFYEEFYGSTLAGPMWYDYMTRVGDSYPTGDFREADDSPFDDRREYRYSFSQATGGGSSNNNNDDDNDD